MDKAPVSKTGDSRFESWLPRSSLWRFTRQNCLNPLLSDLRKRGSLLAVGVDLRCVDCGAEAVSALFWRGPGQHGCSACSGQLILASPADERRQGADRRRRRFLKRWPDWRGGADRRATVPEGMAAKVAS